MSLDPWGWCFLPLPPDNPPPPTSWWQSQLSNEKNPVGDGGELFLPRGCLHVTCHGKTPISPWWCVSGRHPTGWSYFTPHHSDPLQCQWHRHFVCSSVPTRTSDESTLLQNFLDWNSRREETGCTAFTLACFLVHGHRNEPQVYHLGTRFVPEVDEPQQQQRRQQQTPLP